jgi:hypothetical protein
MAMGGGFGAPNGRGRRPARDVGVAGYDAAVRKVLIQAEEELIERAKERAAQRGVSFARFAREAIEKEVGPQREKRTQLIGAFESGQRNTGRRSARTPRVPARRWR